jgi:tetratricopeptide (TPR) repeat protein
VLIEKLQGTSERISTEVISAIYLNLGAIASQLNYPEEAIIYYERCLELRERERNLKDYELIKCYELLGLECLKAESADSAIDWFRKACYAAKNEYGESIELANALLNLGEAFKRSGHLQDAID